MVAYRRVVMERIQRKAELRCISGYRTISAPTVNILVRIPLLEVKIAEIAEREEGYESCLYSAREKTSEKSCPTEHDGEMKEILRLNFQRGIDARVYSGF